MKTTTKNIALAVNASIAATIKANPTASACACIRAVASAIGKKNIAVKRSEFISGATNWVSAGTASRQFYEGRGA